MNIMIQKLISLVQVLFVSHCKLIFILHFLSLFRLSGAVPFPGNSFEEVIKKNKLAKVCLDYKHWKNVSFHARNFIKNLLVKNPERGLMSKNA